MCGLRSMVRTFLAREHVLFLNLLFFYIRRTFEKFVDCHSPQPSAIALSYTGSNLRTVISLFPLVCNYTILLKTSQTIHRFS